MRKNHNEPRGWSTADEIEFIDGIGYSKTHKPTNRVFSCPHLFTKTRKELLKTYLEVCEYRVNWDKIDKEKAVLHAREAIKGGGESGGKMNDTAQRIPVGLA